jgi:hypothetical protein
LFGKEEVPRPILAIGSVVYFMVALPRITASWRSSSRRTRMGKSLANVRERQRAFGNCNAFGQRFVAIEI